MRPRPLVPGMPCSARGPGGLEAVLVLGVLLLRGRTGTNTGERWAAGHQIRPCDSTKLLRNRTTEGSGEAAGQGVRGRPKGQLTANSPKSATGMCGGPQQMPTCVRRLADTCTKADVQVLLWQSRRVAGKGAVTQTGPWSESCIQLEESSAGIVRSYEWPYRQAHQTSHGELTHNHSLPAPATSPASFELSRGNPSGHRPRC